MSTRTWIVYPAGGGGSSGSGITTYSTFSAFPATAANGAVALALDTDNLYAFNTGTMTWVQIGGPGAGANPYYVNEFVLTSTDISNKYVTLSQMPDTPDKTILTVIGGPMQYYGNDYVVLSGGQLNWSGLFLDGVLASGDILIVQFN